MRSDFEPLLCPLFEVDNVGWIVRFMYKFPGGFFRQAAVFRVVVTISRFLAFVVEDEAGGGNCYAGLCKLEAFAVAE